MNSCGPNSLYHVDCDLGQVACADLGMVGALARAALNVSRFGDSLRLVNASTELQELIAFAGLDGVLLGRREREAPLGVEERGEADDLPVRQLEHLERPWLEAPSGPARAVLPEGGQAVRD